MTEWLVLFSLIGASGAVEHRTASVVFASQEQCDQAAFSLAHERWVEQGLQTRWACFERRRRSPAETRTTP